MQHVVCAARAIVTVVVLIVGPLLMLLVAMLTAFQLQRFYRERLSAWQARLILRIWNLRLIVRGEPAPEGEPVIYVSNHSSTIDVFAFAALALPNTRFFMGGFLRWYPFFLIVGYLTGTIWTVRQKFPERRARIFQRAETLLRRTRDSVYLSPEGGRITTGGIGRFNKGAFHLATNLKWPIRPFFIGISRAMDPRRGICTAGGAVDVRFMPAIDTSAWRLEDLHANKERVRDQFVEWHRRFHE